MNNVIGDMIDHYGLLRVINLCRVISTTDFNSWSAAKELQIDLSDIRYLMKKPEDIAKFMMLEYDKQIRIVIGDEVHAVNILPLPLRKIA